MAVWPHVALGMTWSLPLRGRAKARATRPPQRHLKRRARTCSRRRSLPRIPMSSSSSPSPASGPSGPHRRRLSFTRMLLHSSPCRTDRHWPSLPHPRLCHSRCLLSSPLHPHPAGSPPAPHRTRRHSPASTQLGSVASCLSVSLPSPRRTHRHWQVEIQDGSQHPLPIVCSI